MRRRLIYVMQVNEGQRCPGGTTEGAGVAWPATAAPSGWLTWAQTATFTVVTWP
jgi:hypothetical protein